MQTNSQNGNVLWKESSQERMSIPREVVKYLQEEFGVEVGEETIRRGLCRQGLHTQVKQKKPTLLKKDIKACLEFAQSMNFGL